MGRQPDCNPGGAFHAGECQCDHHVRGTLLGKKCLVHLHRCKLFFEKCLVHLIGCKLNSECGRARSGHPQAMQKLVLNSVVSGRQYHRCQVALFG